jgi:hypothetical protein
MGNSFVLNYILPFVAIVISICALGFSIFYSRQTLHLTEKHNLKLVEPLLTHDYSLGKITPDGKYSIQSLDIRNCGFGPAMIKSSCFIIDGEEYYDMPNLYRQKMHHPPKYDNKLGGYKLLKDFVMAPNTKLILFEFYYLYTLNENGAFDFPDKFFELTERMSLKIEFETIYGGKRSYIKPIWPT